MASNLPWKLVQNIRDHATRQGEDIAAAYSFSEPPINPLIIIAEEGSIHAEGDDFGEAFDGRLEYVKGGRFLLAYNTKYDAWPHTGPHHPKVRFTIGHELGHYFLDEHRTILRNGGPQYTCATEFESDPQMEQEADCFAAGLLMPSRLLSPKVNRLTAPTLADVQKTAKAFDVSMTSMLVRWVRLSDFPCGVFSFVGDSIRWGWVSNAFASIGAFRKHTGPTRSPDASRFLRSGPLTQYRESSGLGYLHYWVDTEQTGLSVQEFYAVIPYSKHVLAFITADEDDLPSASED